MVTKMTDLIIKEMKGIITAAEQEQLEAWKSANPVNKKAYDDLNDPQFLVDAIQISCNLDVDAAWQRLEAKLNIKS